MRAASLSDLTDVLAVENKAFLQSDRFTRRQLHSMLTSARARSLVCQNRGLCLGYVTALLTRLPNGGLKGRIYSIAVLPSWQDKSVGTKLLSRMESWLRYRGAAYITLETRLDGHGAASFFRERGYTTIERLPHYYATSDGVRMRKDVRRLAARRGRAKKPAHERRRR